MGGLRRRAGLERHKWQERRAAQRGGPPLSSPRCAAADPTRAANRDREQRTSLQKGSLPAKLSACMPPGAAERTVHLASALHGSSTRPPGSCRGGRPQRTSRTGRPLGQPPAPPAQPHPPRHPHRWRALACRPAAAAAEGPPAASRGCRCCACRAWQGSLCIDRRRYQDEQTGRKQEARQARTRHCLATHLLPVPPLLRVRRPTPPSPWRDRGGARRKRLRSTVEAR